MTEQELLQMRDLAEAGKMQFKERANDRYAANEFVLTIPRTGNQAQLGSDQVTDQFRSESEQPNNQITYKTGITSLKSEQPNIKLSQKQKDFQNFCSVPRTAKEIMDRLGLTDFYNNQME